jgi:hypothetical protein
MNNLNQRLIQQIISFYYQIIGFLTFKCVTIFNKYFILSNLMTTRFSTLPGSNLPIGGYPSTLRRSNVIIGGAPAVLGGPVISNIGATGPVVSTIGAPGQFVSTVGGPSVIGGGLRRSTVIAGGLAPPVQGGLRGSYVISRDQIPAGADIIRVDQPAQYIYKNAPAVPVSDVRRTTVV